MQPLLRALVAQVAALLSLTMLLPYLPALPGVIQLTIQGILATLLGAMLGLPWWWLPINLLLPLAVAALTLCGLPPWIYLAAFVVLLLVQWNSVGDRVPLYLSNRSTWRALSNLLPENETFRFVDLGSGLGGTLFYLAKQHPQAHFVGIESAPLPFAIAWLRCKLLGLNNLQLHYGSLWDWPLDDYQWTYTFLSPEPMPRIYHKWQKEAPREGCLISNSFAVPDATMDRVFVLDDRRQTELYLYKQE